ncbi:MAG: urea transport system substrate-binding protein [Chloroflexota bacterium]|jgi:urea transport system substrate-binding protein|nr:urea transport system substrate-binding protein [Chloroflexota bacterium]
MHTEAILYKGIPAIPVRAGQLRRCSSALAIALLASVLLSACSGRSAPTGAAPSGSTSASGGAATNTVKVGVLHSLSGTMSISETSVKDAELLAIDEINAKGGVLGKQIVPVIEDGASDWPTFAEKTRKLVQQDQVATIFGCWTSASRKAVLPVVESLHALLWYPVQYEGLEASPDIFYTGATTNQQIVPAVDYLVQQGKKKFFLLGSDYVFPRTANQIIQAQIAAIPGVAVVAEEYTPLGYTDYATVIEKIRASDADVVFNTLNGDSNVAFFKQLKDAGLTADRLTTLSVSVAEEEVRGIGADVMLGQLTAWNYFQTTQTPENDAFVKAYKAKYGQNRVTDDPIEAAYDAVYLWKASAEKAGSFDVDKVRAASKGIQFQAPGGLVEINGDNQHISKIVRIGKARADGLFDEVWNSGTAVVPDPFLKTYTWAAAIKPGA